MSIRGAVIRLLPTEDQNLHQFQADDGFRFAWNWGLRLQMTRFENKEKRLSLNDIKKEFRKFRNSEEGKWLQNINASTCVKALDDLDDAFQRYFEKQKEAKYVRFSQKKIAKFARLSKKLTIYDSHGHPKFKKKSKRTPAFYVRVDQFYFEDGLVNIPGILIWNW